MVKNTQTHKRENRKTHQALRTELAYLYNFVCLTVSLIYASDYGREMDEGAVLTPSPFFNT
jgi:hypothetical protein